MLSNNLSIILYWWLPIKRVLVRVLINMVTWPAVDRLTITNRTLHYHYIHVYMYTCMRGAWSTFYLFPAHLCRFHPVSCSQPLEKVSELGRQAAVVWPSLSIDVTGSIGRMSAVGRCWMVYMTVTLHTVFCLRARGVVALSETCLRPYNIWVLLPSEHDDHLHMSCMFSLWRY